MAGGAPVTIVDSGGAPVTVVGNTSVLTFAQTLTTAQQTQARENIGLGQNRADHPGYVSGNFYQGNGGVQVTTGAAIPANSIRAIPFVIKARVTISQLATRISTVSAGGNIQVAVYANNPATGRPTGNALCATGNLSTAAVAAVAANLVGGNTVLEAGIYWFFVNSDNSVAACQAYAGASVLAGYLIGSSTLNNITTGGTSVTLALTLSQTFGTWPDVTAASFTEITTGTYAIPMFKAA